jgi:hypothetical protein
VQALGGYNRRFTKTQDWDLWIRLAEKGEIASLQRYLVMIRKHADQVEKIGGTPQIVYGAAAAACHFLRVQASHDPSADDSLWREFFAWAEGRMSEMGFTERQQAWNDARAEYFARGKGVRSALAFGGRIMRSRSALQMLAERMFRASLPEALAREWMKRTCAGS